MILTQTRKGWKEKKTNVLAYHRARTGLSISVSDGCKEEGKYRQDIGLKVAFTMSMHPRYFRKFSQALKSPKDVWEEIIKSPIKESTKTTIPTDNDIYRVEYQNTDIDLSQGQ